MSETTTKPWGFGLAGNKKGRKAFGAFFIILLVSIAVHIGGVVSSSIQDKQGRPVLALKSFLRDLREYVRTEKRMPADLRELETKIWNKGKDNAASRLEYGNRIIVSDNYEYIYFSGTVEGVSIANVWAIPLGKYRDEAETVLLVVAPDREDTWHGPALSAEQRAFVLEHGFNPTYPQMSSMNMSKDTVKQPTPQSKGRFGLF